MLNRTDDGFAVRETRSKYIWRTRIAKGVPSKLPRQDVGLGQPAWSNSVVEIVPPRLLGWGVEMTVRARLVARGSRAKLDHCQSPCYDALRR